MKLKKTLEIKEAPHWFYSHSSRTLLWKASVAVLPVIFAVTFFSWKASLENLFLVLCCGFGFELIFRKSFGSKAHYKDGDLFLICMALVPLMPSVVNPAAVACTVFFACVIGRFCFGGRGEAVFYSIPLGILGSHLLFRDSLVSPLLVLHANWAVFLALCFSAAVLLHFRVLDFKMGGAFLIITILAILLFNLDLQIEKLLALLYFSLFVVSDSAKPMSKRARIWFAVLSGLAVTLIHLKADFISALSAGLLLVNCFAVRMDEGFSVRNVRVVL